MNECLDYFLLFNLGDTVSVVLAEQKSDKLSSIPDEVKRTCIGIKSIHMNWLFRT